MSVYPTYPKYYDLAELWRQVRLWRSENSKHPWYDAPAKVKVKTKKGLCHLNIDFTLGWPPQAVYEMFTNPRNLNFFHSMAINLPGPVRERREGVAGRGRSRVVSLRRASTKPRATLEYRSRNLALTTSRCRSSVSLRFINTRATTRCRSHNVAPRWSDLSTSLRDLTLARFFLIRRRNRERPCSVALETSLPGGATLRCRCETSLSCTTPAQN
ncbi:LOW QUALITY PROTEIN: hypothetical protein YC2023_083710 [Brassica napus]